MLQRERIKYFTIYRITNRVNGRYYIGKHITYNLDDGYMGSGKVLVEALRKYGRDQFEKEYLFFGFNKQDMDWAEKQLVVTYQDDPLSYNIKPGGEGGSAYGPKNSFFGKAHSLETKAKIRDKKLGKRHSPSTEFQKGQQTRLGISHDETTKQILREATLRQWAEGRAVKRLPGTVMWINNGAVSKMVSPDSEIPEGFMPGRIYKRKK
jgi:hypothetical protein